jgi:nucleoside-diphosphate-sugar epimerase
MRILIAGGTGLIGRATTSALVAAGHRVTVAARTRLALPERVTFAPMDALDPEAVRRTVADAEPDAILNVLTAIPDPIDPRRMAAQFAATDRLRVEGTRHLVAAAPGVRLISESIAFAYDPTDAGVATEDAPLWARPPRQFAPVLDAVRALEDGTRAAGGTVLRLGHLIGPGTSFAAAGGGFTAQVRAGRVPLVGGGHSVFSFAHVADVAAAFVAALDGPAGTYNVVDDEPAEMATWLPLLAERLDARPPRPAPGAIARLAVGGWGVAFMTRLRPAGNEAARTRLSWKPERQWRGSLGID